MQKSPETTKNRCSLKVGIAIGRPILNENSWFDEIMAYFETRTTSGTVEGINNRLKLIKRFRIWFQKLRKLSLTSFDVLAACYSLSILRPEEPLFFSANPR